MTSPDATVEALLDLARSLLADSEAMAASDPVNAAKLAEEAYGIARDHGVLDRLRREHVQPPSRAGEVPLRPRIVAGHTRAQEPSSERPAREDMDEEEQEEADLAQLLKLHRSTVAPPQPRLHAQLPDAAPAPKSESSWRRMIASWGLIAIAFVIAATAARPVANGTAQDTTVAVRSTAHTPL